MIRARPSLPTTGQVVDVQDTGKLKDFASRIAARYPKLNVLINMAGISKAEKLNEAPVSAAQIRPVVGLNSMENPHGQT
jgi:short-subunit dehydrogenase involved in D-alanine esterification of teichoic acids